MYFDSFDICEAYSLFEALYHVGGITMERDSCKRRMESIGCQLSRLRFRHSPMFDGFEDLTENGKEIFTNLVERCGFDASEYSAQLN